MKLFLGISIFLFSLPSFSQDYIEFKNGDVKRVKIIEVNDKDISYRLESAENDGPIYTISIDKVNSVKYKDGTTDDFAFIKADISDMTKINLVEFNAADLMTQRVGITYERFLNSTGEFSFFVPVRISLNDYVTHGNNVRPIAETGIGANLYLLRRRKSNLSIGIETNYTYGIRETYSYIPDPIDPYGWGTYVVEEDPSHFLGFYISPSYKFNIRPRLGLQTGFSVGWKYDLYGTYSTFQGKVDAGIFYRF